MENIKGCLLEYKMRITQASAVRNRDHLPHLTRATRSLLPSALLMFLSPLLSSPLLSSPSPSTPPHSLSQLDSALALGLYYVPFRGPAETDHCLFTIPFPGRESDWPSLSQLSTPSVLSYDWASGAATGDRTAQGPYLWILGGEQIPRRGMG